MEIDNFLPAALQEIMKSPEILSIITSLKENMGAQETVKTESTVDEKSEDSTEKTKEKAPEEGAPSFSLPTDFAEKLPLVLSALTGGGSANSAESKAFEKAENTDSLGAAKEKSAQKHSSAQRMALLRALRPYLSPRRRSVVDALMGLDSLSGLLSAGEKH